MKSGLQRRPAGTVIRGRRRDAERGLGVLRHELSVRGSPRRQSAVAIDVLPWGKKAGTRSAGTGNGPPKPTTGKAGHLVSKAGGVTKVFSRRTLEVFEDASASIPIRQLARAFDGAGIRLGEDDDGTGGARRTQFRRYIASVDQRNPRQLDQLGEALGTLISEVAASKQEFLVKAAERDGFVFVDGIFRQAGTAPSSFAVSSVEDLASLEDRARRLHLLANDSPSDAIGGANELIESACRTVLRQIGAPEHAKAASLADIVMWTLEAIEQAPASGGNAKSRAAIRESLQQFGVAVAGLVTPGKADGSVRARDGVSRVPSPRHARLAVGAAGALAGFVAEAFAERRNVKPAKKDRTTARRP